MENIVFTQISIQEIRNILREEVRTAMKDFANSSTSQNPEYLSIEDVSKMLNLAIPSIYGLVHRKQIPYIKRGKKLIFEKTKIEEWLKNGRRKTKEEIDLEVEEHLINTRKK